MKDCVHALVPPSGDRLGSMVGARESMLRDLVRWLLGSGREFGVRMIAWEV